MAIVELKNVSKIYQMDKVSVKAVDDISFSIDQGSFCAISGPSGSGPAHSPPPPSGQVPGRVQAD